MSIEGTDPIERTGKVSFGGILKKVYLAGLPESKVGDYVLVHAGFALTVVDEEEAKATFELLKAVEELSGPQV
jgi:hydrogenase expression/formation protein HypC